MKIEKHVLKAYDDFTGGDIDSGLMNACISIEGTACKFFEKKQANNKDYKQLLRKYYWLIELFIGGGINLDETIWPDIKLDDGRGKIIQAPDIADIIYHMFRCKHAHCQEIPIEYELLPSGDGYTEWHIEANSVKIPDKVVWALIAVSVFSEANKDINTDTPHTLYWGSNTLGIGFYSFPIKESWGREQDVKSILSAHKPIRVKLDGLKDLNN